MSENTAPTITGVECGHCDVECVPGRFGGWECPECGEGINIKAWYSDRKESTKKSAIERHE